MPRKPVAARFFPRTGAEQTPQSALTAKTEAVLASDGEAKPSFRLKTSAVNIRQKDPS